MLNKLQEEQKDWIKHNFGDRPSWMPLLGAVEELGELAHAHLKQAQGIRVTENHFENKKDAVADIIIYLADYCSAEGINLHEVVENTWNEVKKRDWKKYPEKGLPKDSIQTEITNLTLSGVYVENKGTCRNLEDIYCPICGKEMTHTLESHDMNKMYTVVSCDDHPLIAWEDVFEKVYQPEVSQDWRNCDKRFKY